MLLSGELRSSTWRKMNPTKVERQGMLGEMASEETEIIRRVTRSEDPLRDELLWGICNDFTVEHILTLLPRRSYKVVATLNSDWRRAFQSRMVYDARVRSHQTQEFLLVSCRFGATRYHDCYHEDTIFKKTLSLFSPSEEHWYKIPPIPGCHEGMLHGCSYVLLDCSIYLLGGTRGRKKCFMPSAEVLVLDLAVYPLKWRRCANMQTQRLNPAVGVMHGKIFIFGGAAYSDGFRDEVRNEVYDPKVDAWSFIATTMPSARVHYVCSIRQQFFACFGNMVTPKDPPRRHDQSDNDTKFVVAFDDRGPKLIGTSDDDAEDDMDRLHASIENELVGQQVRLPAKRLASKIRQHEELELRLGSNPFCGFYDPVNDEWREFDKEILGTDDVHDCQPKHEFELWANLVNYRFNDGELDEVPDVSVWSMSM